MVAHELCHAARWGKNDEWINSLFDGMISEGIATYLEAEFVKDREEKHFLSKQFLNEQMKRIKRFLKNFATNLIPIITITILYSLMVMINYHAGRVIP